MQTDDASSAPDQAAAANLQSILANMLSSLGANGPGGMPLPPAPIPPAGGQGGTPGGSPSQGGATRSNSSGGNAAAAAANGMGVPPGLLLLPPGLQFPLQLNNTGLQGLAPFLLNMPGLGQPGMPGADPGAPFLSGLPLDAAGQLNLSALLGMGGLDMGALDPNMDMSGDAMRKAGGGVGSKRPADGSLGGHYKRERSDEGGRAREGKCHVEGCNVELTGLSSYYQRYRTCELHLKAQSIMKDGLQQRFCQQCGRFHELHEFDGNKRSCRARLQSHNQRRRKRTEDQLANQQAEQQMPSMSLPGQGMGPGSGMPSLAHMGLPPMSLGHGAPNLGNLNLGSLGNLSDLLGPAGLSDAALSMLSSAALGAASDVGKGAEDPIAALLSNLPASLQGLLAPPDPNQTLQLAAAALAGTGADLGMPLLDSLGKAAGGPGDMPDVTAAALQHQLAMALAQAPSAATSIVGDGSGPGQDLLAVAAAAAAAAAAGAGGLGDPLQHADLHGKGGGPDGGMHMGHGDGHA